MSCNDILADSEIEYIYKDVKPIDKNVVVSKCIDNNIKEAKIKVFTKDNEEIYQIPIERSYYRARELWGKDEILKVVEHKFFVIEPKYQNQKIATNIHKREIEVYERNNFKEIQLEATCDGFIVWKRLFFNFKDKTDESKIKILIHKYLREVKKYSNEKIQSLIKSNPFKISPNELKSETVSFSEWALNKNMQLVKMYKDIA